MHFLLFGKIKKIFKKNNINEKRIPEHLENDPKISWGVSKIQRLKFDSIILTGESLVDKENSIWGRKVKSQMFMDSIKFYWRIKWIYRGFDCKKIDF